LPLRPTARRFTRPTLGDGTISVIDSATLTVTATIPTGSAPFYSIFRRERRTEPLRSDASPNSSVSYEQSCNGPNPYAGSYPAGAHFEKQEIAIRTDPCPLRLRAVKIDG
jgi:YVTN family beta-propeller protein